MVNIMNSFKSSSTKERRRHRRRALCTPASRRARDLFHALVASDTSARMRSHSSLNHIDDMGQVQPDVEQLGSLEHEDETMNDEQPSTAHDKNPHLSQSNGDSDEDEQRHGHMENSQCSEDSYVVEHVTPFIPVSENEGFQRNESSMNTISLLRDRSKKLLTWSSFLSVLCICGVGRFTKLQYDVIRLIADTAGGGLIPKLSTYKHVREKM